MSHFIQRFCKASTLLLFPFFCSPFGTLRGGDETGCRGCPPAKQADGVIAKADRNSLFAHACLPRERSNWRFSHGLRLRVGPFSARGGVLNIQTSIIFSISPLSLKAPPSPPCPQETFVRHFCLGNGADVVVVVGSAITCAPAKRFCLAIFIAFSFSVLYTLLKEISMKNFKKTWNRSVLFVVYNIKDGGVTC